MFCVRNLPVLSLFLASFMCLLGRISASELSAGPLFQDFKLTLDPGHRTEIAGPLYYQQELTEPNNFSRLWAVPPIFSYLRDNDTDYEQFDFLWKAICYNRYGAEYRFHIAQLFGFSGGQTQSETNVSRFTLFPFYFQQRSSIPELNYTALLPLYGRIRDRFFREEIQFMLFPIYGQSRKRDVVTDNYLYPFFHLRHGDGLKGWQFWPLFSHELKEVTSKTNVWDELETVGGHRKRFILWPIFMEEHTGLGTANPAHQQALLPFYTYLHSPDRDSITYLWPIGPTHTVDRQKRYEEWGAPWPLIVFTRGEGKNVNRVWPFFSQGSNANSTSDWYLWPIYKYNRLHSDPLDRERTRILLFLYSDVSVKNTETGKRLRQIDLWPLFTSHRDLEGRNRLQILALLEPFLPNNTSVERDLSPLWSLWRAEKNSKTGATSQSLLWNLYRRETAPERKKCSLLFGLYQYESGREGRRWRLLYVPFGTSRHSDKPSLR